MYITKVKGKEVHQFLHQGKIPANPLDISIFHGWIIVNRLGTCYDRHNKWDYNVWHLWERLPPPRPLRCIHSGWLCSQEHRTQWPARRSWRSAYRGPPSVPPAAPETWTDLTTHSGYISQIHLRHRKSYVDSLKTTKNQCKKEWNQEQQRHGALRERQNRLWRNGRQ